MTAIPIAKALTYQPPVLDGTGVLDSDGREKGNACDARVAWDAGDAGDARFATVNGRRRGKADELDGRAEEVSTTVASVSSCDAADGFWA